MNEHVRLFVGLRLAVPTANALASAAETLARRAKDAGIDIRWVAPVGYHVTLAFLGNTRRDALAAVRDMLDEAASGQGGFELKTRGVGAFGTPKPRVVWAGIDEPTGQLAALAKRVHDGVQRLGYTDPKPFHAHVTLGRVKDVAGRGPGGGEGPGRAKSDEDLPAKLASLREVVLPLSEQMFGVSKIDQITLFESETKSTGSVYREVHRAAFKTARSEGPESQKRQTGALGLTPGATVDDRLETDDGWPRGHDQ